MSDCCSPGGHCSKAMDTQMTEEVAARFEELAALEHEFEDVEEEISMSHNIALMAIAHSVTSHR
jgi:hypothetical protein